MEVIKCNDKEELFEKLEEIEGNEEEIYISLRPTQEITEEILERAETLKKLKCPESLYYQVGEKVAKKLKDQGVQLEPGDFSPGRPKKYSEEEIERMLELREKGKSVKEISENMEVPVRTVYFYLNKENPV